jgi:hypothetical protein
MYILNFIEEYWNVKPKYQNSHMGRVEIFETGKEWATNELRFFAPPSDEWEEFRDKWDLEETDDLEKFKELLTKFQCE